MSLGFVATGLGAAEQTPSGMMNDVKKGLETVCGEFHARHVNTFFSDGKFQTYRYTDLRVENNVMHWKKYLATRTGNSGSGNVYYYSVRLTDLDPARFNVEQIKIDNMETNVWALDLRCATGQSCIGQNIHPLHPPGGNASQPLSQWMEGPLTRPNRVNDVRFHVCDFNDQNRSRAVANVLQVDMRQVVNMAKSGTLVNAGGSAPGYTPQPYSAPAPYTPPPGVPAQPYYPPPTGAPAQPYYPPATGAPGQPYYPPATGAPGQPYYPPGAPGQPYYPPTGAPPGAGQPYVPPPGAGAAPYYPPPGAPASYPAPGASAYPAVPVPGQPNPQQYPPVPPPSNRGF